MAWFKKTDQTDKYHVESKEDIWVRCNGCKAHVIKEEWFANLSVCPKCNFHGRISCHERLNLLVDNGSFIESNETIVPYDSLGFKDGKGSYLEKISTAMRKTGLKESVITGHGRILGKKVVLAVMDFHFLGGSLGSGTGEKIFQAAIHASENHLPLIIVSASGGARMQEGVLSLMQMAKTCAGIAQVNKKQLPYISVLTDPTSGGVSASYAMMGDINIAEPGALIAFAGRRVIEQTIKQKLPDDFQSAEYLLEHGFIDCITTRRDMKNKISSILDYYNRR